MFSKKDLYRLIIPLVIEQVLAVTVGMADTIMIASRGEAAVSGVSLVDAINILIIGLFSALATGGAVVAAQYIGHKEPEKACTAANQLILSVTLLSAVLLVVSFIGNQLLLSLIYPNLDAEVMSNAKVYFYISALSYPFIAVYNAGAALFRAMGNSKVSMKVSLVMNVINIAGNAFFLFALHMGTAGVAWASLISRIVAAIAVITMLRNGKHLIHIKHNLRFGYHPSMIKRILRIGIPNGLENSIFQIGKILVSGLIASFGTMAITANAVAGTVANFEVIPGNAIGLAMITIVGQCVGAGSFDQAKKYTGKLMKYTYIAFVLLNIVIILCLDPICSLYGLSAQTEATARELILYHSICGMIIWPASFTLPNALRAANDAKYTMSISIISMWVWRIAFSYVLAKGLNLGVLGVWMAMTIDWLFRSICFVIRFRSGKWKKKAYMEKKAIS